MSGAAAAKDELSGAAAAKDELSGAAAAKDGLSGAAAVKDGLAARGSGLLRRALLSKCTPDLMHKSAPRAHINKNQPLTDAGKHRSGVCTYIRAGIYCGTKSGALKNPENYRVPPPKPPPLKPPPPPNELEPPLPIERSCCCFISAVRSELYILE